MANGKYSHVIMFVPTSSIANDINQATSNGPPTVVDALRMHPLFGGLQLATEQQLLGAAVPWQLAAGQWLFREGGVARQCLLLLEGQVEVLRMGLDGEERVYHLYGPGQLVAEAAMFMPHGRYPMSARAHAPVLALRLPRQTLRQACSTDPALALRVLEWLGERIYQRTNEVDWLTGSSAAQRLAAYLLSLRGAGDSCQVHLPLQIRQVAARLGVRPETLSRLLSDWQRAGHLRGQQRDWEILEPEYLAELASASRRDF